VHCLGESVAEANIDHLSKRLATETDECPTTFRLLPEGEASFTAPLHLAMESTRRFL
jgi:hypothetical protein